MADTKTSHKKSVDEGTEKTNTPNSPEKSEKPEPEDEFTNISIEVFNSYSIEERKAIVAKKRRTTVVPSIPIIASPQEDYDEEDDDESPLVELGAAQVPDPAAPLDPASMIVSINTILDAFSQPMSGSLEKVTTAFGHILHHLRPFFIYPHVSLRVRSLLFLVTEYPTKYAVQQFVKTQIMNLAAELIHIKPLKTKHWLAAINGLTSSLPYDPEADLMPYSWQHQFAFETSIFLADEHLKTFVAQFFDTVDPTIRWGQLQSFSKEIAKYYHEQYGVNQMPQLTQFASRALHAAFTREPRFGPLIPYKQTLPEYVKQISRIRQLTASKLLVREKFMKPGTFTVPIGSCPDLFPYSVKVANEMAYATIPEDLFESVIALHEAIFDEIIRNQFIRAKTKQSFAQFKTTSPAIGQEDIMPIMILVLVLSDLPNLAEICDFFNEYSIQIQNNSKTGLYMANITLAYGAIQNWTDFD